MFLISSIILCLTIRVRQHRKYTCKSTLIMIFSNYVTCWGGGGVTLFDGLGPLFESYGLGPLFESYNTQSTGYSSINLQERIHKRVLLFSFSSCNQYAITYTHIYTHAHTHIHTHTHTHTHTRTLTHTHTHIHT